MSPNESAFSKFDLVTYKDEQERDRTQSIKAADPAAARELSSFDVSHF